MRLILRLASTFAFAGMLACAGTNTPGSTNPSHETDPPTDLADSETERRHFHAAKEQLYSCMGRGRDPVHRSPRVREHGLPVESFICGVELDKEPFRIAFVEWAPLVKQDLMILLNDDGYSDLSRIRCAMALARTNGEDVAILLAGVAADKSTRAVVRDYCVRALGLMRDPVALRAIEAIASAHEDDRFKREILLARALHGDAAAERDYLEGVTSVIATLPPDLDSGLFDAGSCDLVRVLRRPEMRDLLGLVQLRKVAALELLYEVLRRRGAALLNVKRGEYETLHVTTKAALKVVYPEIGWALGGESYYLESGELTQFLPALETEGLYWDDDLKEFRHR